MKSENPLAPETSALNHCKNVEYKFLGFNTSTLSNLFLAIVNCTFYKMERKKKAKMRNPRDSLTSCRFFNITSALAYAA